MTRLQHLPAPSRTSVLAALGVAVAALVACSPAPTEEGAETPAASDEQPAAPAAPPPASPLERGLAFLAENGKRATVTTTASGLQYEVLASGTGAKPGPTDTVTTHYHGTFIDGRVFDSSVDRGAPAEFRVDGVIAGWTEALQLMAVGDKWKLYVPSQLAYGERGSGAIGPNETLIFEVELLGVKAG